MHEENNTACSSSQIALTVEVMVERAVKNMEKRKLKVHCQDIKKKPKEVIKEEVLYRKFMKS